MGRYFAVSTPTCCSFLFIFTLLLQSARPTQPIALSSLCGQFGHSCFGGNWGKRELSRATLESDLIPPNVDINNDEAETPVEISRNAMHNFLVEQLRSRLARQRLRQLLELE